MSERAMAPIRMRRPAWVDGFRALIMRGNVVDLAVGIIIGVAFGFSRKEGAPFLTSRRTASFSESYNRAL